MHLLAVKLVNENEDAIDWPGGKIRTCSCPASLLSCCGEAIAPLELLVGYTGSGI